MNVPEPPLISPVTFDHLEIVHDRAGGPPAGADESANAADQNDPDGTPPSGAPDGLSMVGADGIEPPTAGV